MPDSKNLFGFGTEIVGMNVEYIPQCSVDRFRPLRAGVFITFGLSGIAPATHYCVVNGWDKAVDQVAIGWLILMGCLYITGALLYAVRIPERFFPGKLDIWVRSFIDVVKRRADA